MAGKLECLEEFTVDKCCFCIDLKIACYIISFISIIILVPSTAGAVEQCYEGNGTIRLIQGLGAFMFLLALAAAIFFIYGLCMEVRLPTMTYMAVTVLAMLVTFLAAALILSQKPMKETCPDSVALAASAIIELAVQVYCFVVVNSYRVLQE